MGVNSTVTKAATADIDRSVRIAAWGDSLTLGSGATLGSEFPTKLATLSGYTVSNGGVGGETSTQIKARMLADTAKYTWPTVIWAGRNNYSSPSTVLADVAAMVSALGHSNYLVLSVLNGEFGATEYSGGAGYNQIATINAGLASAYGAHYVDVRSYLISLYNSGVPQDVIDHGHDIVPSSLRSDTIHLNNAGYLAVATKVYESIGVLGFAKRYLTTANLAYLLGAPPTIGQRSNITAYANRLLFGAGSTAAPSLCGQGTQSKTGFYWSGSNQVYTVSNGSGIFSFSLNFQALQPRGPLIKGGTGATSTVPVICPDNTGTTTGLGASSAGALSLIGGGVESARVESDAGFRHLSTKLGFFGAASATKPSVTGSRGGNAALASLLTALANLGLITDNTTA